MLLVMLPAWPTTAACICGVCIHQRMQLNHMPPHRLHVGCPNLWCSAHLQAEAAALLLHFFRQPGKLRMRQPKSSHSGMYVHARCRPSCTGEELGDLQRAWSHHWKAFRPLAAAAWQAWQAPPPAMIGPCGAAGFCGLQLPAEGYLSLTLVSCLLAMHHSLHRHNAACHCNRPHMPDATHEVLGSRHGGLALLRQSAALAAAWRPWQGRHTLHDVPFSISRLESY